MKGEQEDGEEEVDEIKKVKVKLPVSLINPLKPELNPIFYLLALLGLTIFSTLAG